MPNAEPYRAWATFSFTAASGRINECDLLIAVPGGLYLVELKGHPGRAINNGDTWSFSQEGSKRVLTLRNPLHLLDLKCKDLKTRLEWAARQLHISQRVPWVEPAIFLSAHGLKSDLDEVQRSHVYGRDQECDGLPWIWRDLLAKPPQREARRVTPEFSKHIPALLAKIGIAPATAHLRFGDDWKLQPEPLDVGPTWEDRLAEHTGIVREEGRVRIYLTAQQATDEAKRSVERAARREYQVLQGINHRGIAQAVQIREHQGGPAILFRHRESDLRLDSYLDVHGATLAPETRLDMVRQLAEAVRYAHSRSLYHRALAAQSVYVSAKEDGSAPVLRIIDWQSAARDFDTTGMSSIMTSSPAGEHISDPAEVYFAPEFETPYADPVDLDVFGLGAIGYLLVTGQPPAPQRSGLIERLTTEGGLHPYAVSDAVSDALDDLIVQATRTDVADRLDSAEAFLDALDLVEQDEPAPEPAGPGLDPLTATPGQLMDGDWTVERVLGTGATSRVLLLSRPVDDDDSEQQRELRVLKIALDQEKSARLDAEATALAKVGGGVVVQLLGGPRELGGRTVLDLEYAGEKSLGAWLRAEGKLSYHDLERFGGDLFTALDQLAGKGVQHRDLKPDNFGVFKRADRSRQLMLFDFSLAGISERDIKAGTRGYLDPFLGTPQRPAFDDHAERYAAAVTLHEMASGLKPVWGDGITDPRTTRDETPALATELFEAALQDGLTAFFLRAFHRDVDRRFDSVRQMTDAWRAVFAAADATTPTTTPATVRLEGQTLEEARDSHAEAAELTTSLDAAGLSPRAVSVAQSFGATTVGELLGVKLYEIAKARGAGATIRKELNRRHKQWTARLLHPAGGTSGTKQGGPATAAGAAVAGRMLTVEDMAMLLAPSAGRRGSKKADVVRRTLGLPDDEGVPDQWPAQVDVAKKLGITQASVSRHQQTAAKEWTGQPWLDDIRSELVDLVAEAGRVMTAPELAAQLRARHGTLLDEGPDRILARALAVVRAAVEVELRVDLNQDETDSEPRVAVLRRGGRVVIALESLPGADDPSAPELADYALGLGQRADELATQDPLPGRAVVIRDLRAVRAPDGLAPLADTRLVSLAAAMSQHAAASPRLELYPRGLELAKALRISQAPAGVRHEAGITVDDLVTRVRARFPELALDGITYVRLEDALASAGFPLTYDTTTRRFRPPAPDVTRSATSSRTSTSAHGRLSAAGLDPQAALATKLGASAERGGFLALALRGKYLPGAADTLTAHYRVTPVDVDQKFLAALHELAKERGQTWDRVLSSDARFTATGQLGQGLRSYVERAWERIGQQLRESAGDGRTVLFLHNAGLLARYFDAGGHALLTSLQNAARRPSDVPHGLWLLCPAESELDSPQLDGQIVEVLGESERVVLTRSLLAGLRDGAGSAA